MADDITLTVRVRDMTRGEFNQIRQRMRGMDGDVRRLAQANGQASQSADRFGQSLRGVQGRLGQLQRTGRLATSEMDHMRRSMRLLGRDLAQAARAGDLTEDEFRSLREELERTRLDFDHLDNNIRRHNAVAQAAHRAEMQRQREAAAAARQAQREETTQQREADRLAREERRRQEALARAIVAERNRIVRAHAAALREEAGRQAAAQREADRIARDEQRRQMTLANQIVAQQRRLARAHAAALREEMTRNRRAEAERRRAAAAAAADFRRQVGRLAAPGGDEGLTLRFRALGEGDINRMTRGFSRLTTTIGGVSGSSARARRNVSALAGDLRTMSQVLQNAQRDGNLTRREFNALSNGLRLAGGSARDLRRSNDLSRAGYRDMRREIERLAAQLRLIGDEGTRLTRLNDRLQLLQRRLGDVDSSAGRTRRTLSRMGEGGLGGLRGVVRGLSMLGAGFGNLRDRVKNASHGMKMFLLIVGLIGPLAAPVGALLTTALGGAFLALGAFALRGEKDVRAAFTRMKSTIGSTVRAAAQPMRSALVSAMDQAGAAVEAMGGQMNAAFAATAPLVENIVGAITDFAARSLPGLTQSLQAMGPVIEGFRSAMGTLGEGVGQMFAEMTAGGGAEGLRNAWLTMGREIKILLVNIGQFINGMSQSESATGLLVAMFRALSGILIIVEGAFKAVDATIVPVLDKIGDLGDALSFGDSPSGIDSLGKLFDALGVSSSGAGETVESFKGKIDASAAAVKKNAAAVKELIDKIKELNELNRSNLDARAAQQQAILDAEKGYKKFSDALSMTNGQLNMTNQASLDAYELLSQIAGQTNAATTAAQDAKRPWQEVQDLWKTGYDNIVTFADGMGLTAEEARILADQLLKMPDAEVSFKAETAQATADLQNFVAAVKASPGSKSVTLKTLSRRAEQILENFGYKVERLPDGRVKVTAATGTAQSRIEYIKNILAALDGTTARTYIETINTTIYQPGAKGRSLHEILSANGNIVKFFGSGGMNSRSENHVAQMAPAGSWRIWGEPETGGESYIPHSPSKRARSRTIAEQTVDILGGQVEWFAKGGKKSKAQKKKEAQARSEREARSQVIGELTISHFGKMAGFKTDEFRKALALPDTLGQLVNDLNKWRSVIKKTTHGGLEKSLLKQLDKAGKSLIRYEKAHAKVEKQLEKAKDRLADLKQAASQLRDSVKSGVMSATDITRVASGDKPVTVSAIMGQMRQSVDKSTAFAQALKDLAKKGVSRTIIEQIATAGIEGGGLETAGALLSASQSEIATINQMQGKINAAATSAGKTTADIMYGAGIKAAEGMVEGLTKKKKDIEKAMMDIAKAMEKAIKKALGIKSPSTVMQKVGGFTADGFAMGVEKNRRVDSAWMSMLNSGPSRGRGGAVSASSPGSAPQVIQLVVAGRVVDEIILDSNRRAVRTRGGNVQAVFGR